MTTREKAEIAQLRRDVATLARRILPSSGGKPDIMDVIARNGGSTDVPYHVVSGAERTVP
jgi:hypothetical protein